MPPVPCRTFFFVVWCWYAYYPWFNRSVGDDSTPTNSLEECWAMEGQGSGYGGSGGGRGSGCSVVIGRWWEGIFCAMPLHLVVDTNTFYIKQKHFSRKLIIPMTFTSYLCWGKVFSLAWSLCLICCSGMLSLRELESSWYARVGCAGRHTKSL